MSAQIKTVDDPTLGKQTELHIDGHFNCSFDYFELSDIARGRLQNMIVNAIDHGKYQKMEEMRKVLGC